MDNTAGKRKYNRKTYATFIFRVRRDSELAKLLQHHADEGETSVNFLISIALCNFLKCKLPHREYVRKKRTRIV